MFEHTRHDPWGSLALRRSVDRICSKIYAMAASNTFRKPTPVGLYDAAEPQAHRSYRRAVAAAGTYVDWATLLRRVFDVVSLQCLRCGGRPRVIASITEGCNHQNP